MADYGTAIHRACRVAVNACSLKHEPVYDVHMVKIFNYVKEMQLLDIFVYATAAINILLL